MLPLSRLHTDSSKEAYAENLAKIASELRVLEANLVREVFCAQSVTKMIRT